MEWQAEPVYSPLLWLTAHIRVASALLSIAPLRSGYQEVDTQEDAAVVSFTASTPLLPVKVVPVLGC